MKKFSLVLLLALAAPAAAQSDPRQAPTVVANPADVGVGKTFSDPALTKARENARLLVVAFAGADCPLSKLYRPKLERLSKEYGEGKDVRLIVVATDDPVLVPVLGPTRTTEAFVLDSAGVLRYRGAVDDQYGIGYHRDAATRNYVTDAITALLAGQEPPVAATEAPGCCVEPMTRAPAAPLTFHKNVEAIFQRRCVTCHRPGEIGPFSLLKYETAKANARTIKQVVGERRMPPWQADPKTGEWLNDRHLSDAEIATISSWVDTGALEGDPADAPPPSQLVEGWQIGTPDTIYRIPQPQKVKAEGSMPYAYIEVPTELEEDRWIQAMEVRATARAAVHHILVFVKYPKDRKDEQPVIDGGLLNGYFAVMVPGESPTVYRDGMGKKLPAGARLVFQIHYTPTGKVLEDQSMIGIVWAKKPATQEVVTRGIVNQTIRIPAGAPDHEETASFQFENDAKILSFLPHMHLRGKAFKYVKIDPDGKKEVLLDIPAYDFNWQTSYILKEPLLVKKGTRIKVYARYDNSANNPANPDPTKRVRFGEQTWQEMLIGYMDFVEVPDPPAKGAAPSADQPF